MKKILVNVNEQNLEKIRDEWAGMRGYRSSNSDIVSELMMSELFRLQQLHDFGKFDKTVGGVMGTRRRVRTLDQALKENGK